MRFPIIVSTVVLAATASSPAHQAQCGVPNIFTNYIIRGEEATPLEFPWQVSLQLSVEGQWRHACGASIIDKSWILTVAHCVDPRVLRERGVPPNVPLRALIGAHNVTHIEKLASAHLIDMKHNVYMHPLWNIRTLDYDYALIQLPKPLDFAGDHSHLTPICLPQADDNFENMDCVTSGWGLTKDSWNPADAADVLQKLAVRVTPQEDCVRAYLNNGNSFGSPIHVTPRQICVFSIREGGGTCKGDSGGPLQCKLSDRYVLVGATSFGRKCASETHPKVFARISVVLPWIKGITTNETREF